MTAADLAIATQHAIDQALEAIADDRPAVALVKFAAVEHLAHLAAAAIQREAIAHIRAEATAAFLAEMAATTSPDDLVGSIT